MNATIDSELVKVVQKHVNKLSSEVEKIAFESQEEMNNLKVMLHNVKIELQECEKRFVRIENNMSITADKIAQLTTNQEVLQQEVEHLQTSQTSVQQSVTEDQTSSYGNILLILPIRHIMFSLYNRNIINMAGILIFII